MRRTVLALVLLASLIPFTGCGSFVSLGPIPGPTVTSRTFFKGMTQAGYSPTVFDTPAATSSIPALKAAHVDTLAIQVGWYQKTPTSTTLAPSPLKTPTDASIVALVRRAHKAGMHVFLNPFVNSLTGNAWNADFHPTSWRSWFKSYDAFLVHYAAIAEREHVEIFSIGDESDSADGDPVLYPEWKNAIAQVRKVYHGPITYGADFPTYQKVTFWKDLDYVGIDPYFSLAPQGDLHPSLASLEGAWNNLADQIEKWRQSAGLTAKPFLIVELGYYSGQGVAAQPAFWRPGAPVDLAAQADCYRATLSTIYNRRWLKGLIWFWWANPSNPDWQGGKTDNGYTIRGKPAYQVLAKGFASPRSYGPIA